MLACGHPASAKALQGIFSKMIFRPERPTSDRVLFRAGNHSDGCAPAANCRGVSRYSTTGTVAGAAGASSLVAVAARVVRRGRGARRAGAFGASSAAAA